MSITREDTIIYVRAKTVRTVNYSTVWFNEMSLEFTAKFNFGEAVF